MGATRIADPNRPRHAPESSATERVRALGTETAFAVAAAARRVAESGRDVVLLHIGEPGIPTPPHIVEAGIRALRDGITGYVAPVGIPELRGAIADTVGARGIPCAAENVVVTSGAKPLMLYTLLALTEPGDEVLVPDPGFPIYESVARLGGARPVPYVVRTGADGVAASEIAAKIGPRTKLLVLNAPHNPTGSLLAPAELDALAELVLEHDLSVLSDEVYGRLIFAGRHESIASRPGLAERTVLVDSFSKTYAMTGWRLGFAVMPAPLVEHVSALIINNTSCAPPFVQHAGIAALRGSQQCVDDLVVRLRGTRDTLVRGLASIDGVRITEPVAAFYAFPDITPLLDRSGLTVNQAADALLERHGVAALAGTGFGAGGDRHLRLSYATAPERITLAVSRLRDWAADLSSRS
ncbi:MAG TPA: pyridoxal phosphate-dependent aminotransferase [Gemmatimonadaceae bacterium]|nr:pyridoxal phosphate-dependent aminotransferase [Gemmatimonadaceae bacterium]